MHIHILGICGTFMGGIAAIAKQLGHRVSGCDANVYPPMSTQLEQLGIELKQGYLTEHLKDEPDLVIVGNAMSRGNVMVEYVLDRNIAYTSGPQWLLDNVLKDRWVLAISALASAACIWAPTASPLEMPASCARWRDMALAMPSSP